MAHYFKYQPAKFCITDSLVDLHLRDGEPQVQVRNIGVGDDAHTWMSVRKIRENALEISRDFLAETMDSDTSG